MHRRKNKKDEESEIITKKNNCKSCGGSRVVQDEETQDNGYQTENKTKKILYVPSTESKDDCEETSMTFIESEASKDEKNEEESKQEESDLQKLSSQQVWEEIKDSIVNLYDQVTLPNGQGIPTVFNDVDSGFLIEDGYVVVCSFSVTIPQSSGSIRTPPSTQNVGPVRKGRTWVQVFNVNGSGKTYVYETVLVGVDGSAGVAVLWIDPCLPWNKDLPVVRNKGLTWGDSRQAAIGDPCYSAGFSLGVDFRAFNKGIIRNNRWTAVNGQILSEHVLVSLNLNPGMTGAPLIDKFGRVIGVADNFLFDTPQVSWASSQVIVQPIIEQLIVAFESKSPIIANPSIVLVNDPLGPYLVHIKGYLGLSYVVRYDSNFTGGVSFPTMDACTTVSNPEGPSFKRSVGLVITGVDGGGGCNFVSSQTPSPFVGDIVPGDLVTHITYCRHGDTIRKVLGDIAPQIAPGNVTFFLVPGDIVTLTYRKKSEGYTSVHKITRAVKQYPAEFDSVGRNVAV